MASSYAENLEWVTSSLPQTRIEKLRAQLWVARAEGNILRMEELHRQLDALGYRESKR